MTLEEAKRLGVIVVGMSHDECPICLRNTCKQLSDVFPSFVWKYRNYGIEVRPVKRKAKA